MSGQEIDLSIVCLPFEAAVLKIIRFWPGVKQDDRYVPRRGDVARSAVQAAKASADPPVKLRIVVVSQSQCTGIDMCTDLHTDTRGVYHLQELQA